MLTGRHGEGQPSLATGRSPVRYRQLRRLNRDIAREIDAQQNANLSPT